MISDDFRRISMNTDLRGAVGVIGIAVSWLWVCLYKARHQVADKEKVAGPWGKHWWVPTPLWPDLISGSAR
jgi:hypothetical protein